MSDRTCATCQRKFVVYGSANAAHPTVCATCQKAARKMRATEQNKMLPEYTNKGVSVRGP